MADNFNLRTFLSENKLTKNAQLLKEEAGEREVNEAKEYSFTFNYNTDEDDVEYVQNILHNAGVDAIAEPGIDSEEMVVKALNAVELRRARKAIEADGFEVNERVEEEQAPENTEDYTKQPGYVHEALTAKELRLVEMVQDAIGNTNNDEDQEFDPGHDIEQAQHNIERQYEGEESIEEAKPLPKYNSIEDLMKEIEHGTNEAAHKYKMDEMKRVYEALEAKVSSLEEGEHAEHIDQKAVKQMRKDIAALRKAEEKLRKEFDKKFSGKEKKEAPKKEKEVVALAEGFDLRKYLAENRK